MPSAGSFISPLIKIAVTVATLAAVYLFILKPILDTTSETIDKINAPLQRSLELNARSVNQALEQAQQQGQGTVTVPQGATGTTTVNVSQRQAQRLLGCVQRAQGNVNRLQACQRRFLPNP